MGSNENITTKKPIRQLKLDIADIIMEARCADNDTSLQVYPEIQKFIVEDGQPDCVLNVHFGPLPDVKIDQLIVDSGYDGPYLIGYNRQKIVFKMRGINNVLNQAFIHRLAIFEPDFKKGDLYISPKDILPIEDPIPPDVEKLSLNPFVNPLDEMLLVNLLAMGRGLHIHALGVIHEGHGLVFCGVSGAGKSTLAELWKKRPVKILSDDRIALRRREGKIWAYGTPWHGDARVSLPEKAPLKALFFLKQAPENRIVTLSVTEVATRFIVRSFPTFYLKQGMEYTLRFIDELAHEAPCYELEFTPDQRAIDKVLSHVDNRNL